MFVPIAFCTATVVSLIDALTWRRHWALRVLAILGGFAAVGAGVVATIRWG